jgi:hypothetical protein
MELPMPQIFDMTFNISSMSRGSVHPKTGGKMPDYQLIGEVTYQEDGKKSITLRLNYPFEVKAGPISTECDEEALRAAKVLVDNIHKHYFSKSGYVLNLHLCRLKAQWQAVSHGDPKVGWLKHPP